MRSLAASSTHSVIRTCIICGVDDAEDMFTFTRDFLVNIRDHNPVTLTDKGWTDDVTSTIVKCRKCSSIYIRDLHVSSEEYWEKRNKDSESAESLEARRNRIASKETFRQYADLDAQNWTVRNVIQLSAEGKNRDIKFLDYGAGGAETSNMARGCGVHHVVAYDPHYAENIQEIHNKTNFPGILSIRDEEQLAELGPFDAVVFQSAIEHVTNPLGELKTIFSLMAPGGYFYVNNPVMDLNKELGQLKAAKKIVKKDRISYYHPDHLNYLTARQFEDLLKSVGFKVTARTHYPPVLLSKKTLRKFVFRQLKVAIRTTQNLLGLPYDRQYFIVQKP